MKAPDLKTNNPNFKLIEPVVERDDQLGVAWLNSESGRETMLLMGNSKATIDKILPTTLEIERKRVEGFIERSDQLNWMIEYEGTVVGSIWVDVEGSKDLPGPSVHIMIGDPNMRGKGIGKAAMGAVLDFLKEQGNGTIYSRHLVTNQHADELLKVFGFVNLDVPYTSDGVLFQNLVLKK